MESLVKKLNHYFDLLTGNIEFKVCEIDGCIDIIGKCDKYTEQIIGTKTDEFYRELEKVVRGNGYDGVKYNSEKTTFIPIKE